MAEGQLGHQTADTMCHLDPVLPLRAVWHSPSPMFLLASSPFLLETMEAPSKQAPLLHLPEKGAMEPTWNYYLTWTGQLTGMVGRILALQR